MLAVKFIIKYRRRERASGSVNLAPAAFIALAAVACPAA